MFCDWYLGAVQEDPSR